jgi:hypothetical protein
MSRPYQYTNLNWRDQSRTWEWSTKYAEWLSLAEQHRHHKFTALERNLCHRSALEIALSTGSASEL